MLTSRVLKEHPPIDSDAAVLSALRKFGPMDRQLLFVYFRATHASLEENVDGIRGKHLHDLLARLHAAGRVAIVHRKAVLPRDGVPLEVMRPVISLPEDAVEAPKADPAFLPTAGIMATTAPVSPQA